MPASGEWWCLLRSDAHHDHPCSRRDIEQRHLAEALECGAGILDFGDLFCAMQGYHDRRRSDDKRDEDRGEGYYSRLVRNAADWYLPYARNLILLARGNHETSTLKHSEVDLTGDLAAWLRERASTQIAVGGYRGYVQFHFGRHKWLLYYVHGGGQSAPVTRGVIQTNRRAVWLRDPDMIVSGHTHHAWLVPIVRETLNGTRKGRAVQWHAQIPSYKDVLQSRDMGWEIEKEFGPQPLGAWWLRFRADGGALNVDIMYAS